MQPIWFWQQLLTPHMAYLAEAVAKRGHPVTYIATIGMSEYRSRMGWELPTLDYARLIVETTPGGVRHLAETAPINCHHYCEGLRSNGLVLLSQQIFARKKILYSVLMETVNDRGIRGLIKRATYHAILRQRAKQITAIYAIGHKTGEWLSRRGYPRESIVPFAYFIEPPKLETPRPRHVRQKFRFVFIGQLIRRKRLDLLISSLPDSPNVKLTIAGAGPCESSLKKLASQKAQLETEWLGTISINEVPRLLQQCDCLVLPSRFDGWGAVVSESLAAGTPVICSDMCGAAGIAKASNHGNVFQTEQPESLTQAIKHQLTRGPITLQERLKLQRWAMRLTSESGADYLLNILNAIKNGRRLPGPPWLHTT